VFIRCTLKEQDCLDINFTYSHVHAINVTLGVNPGVLGGRDPQDFGQGGHGGIRGSWTGRKILLYLIMYTKYVRKW